MSAFALITGSLYRAPEKRTSKSGKPFATATAKVKINDTDVQWWRILAFTEAAQAELMRLREGDVLTAQGALKAELWTPDGGPSP